MCANRACLVSALALGVFASLLFASPLAAAPARPEPIPLDQIGAVAGKQYHGDGLSVAATPDGARLQCVFQRLEGQANPEGLWLTSTADASKGERFRVLAVEVGRAQPEVGPARRADQTADNPVGLDAPNHPQAPAEISQPACNARWKPALLTSAGTVQLADNLVRFTRPGLTEEYSVSVDGIRQDFVVLEPPVLDSQPSTLNQPAGPLRLELSVTGARVEPRADGARLVLEGSGRSIAYHRLRVTDATGKELPARIEVQPPSAFSLQPSALSLLVDDSAAAYPIRIDPSFSDDNWISMGGLPGANDRVRAAVIDAAGNLYIGGDFTAAGEVIANRVAKWNGTNWSALGEGLNGTVYALAVSGSDLCVGGSFTYATNAGPSPVRVNGIAKWNGSSWSALGSGLGGSYPFVRALAVSGSDLYVGGYFTTAGGSAANCIAKWDGTTWSALGTGLDAQVYALAVSGSDLYVGGQFHYATNAGPSTVQVNGIAKWDGSNWSPLGSGVSGNANALAMSGSDLYVGGDFTTAGGSAAKRIAKWNGTSWSSLGSGLNTVVSALAASGSDLYVGGYFTYATNAGPSPVRVNRIAKWDGNSWSALGSGLNSNVCALAVSGTNLYAGGAFTTAGGKVSAYVAKANINAAGGRFNSPSWSLAAGFSCTFSDATPGQPYRIQTSPSLAPGSWTDLSSFTYTAPITITEPSFRTTAPRYYRAVWSP